MNRNYLQKILSIVKGGTSTVPMVGFLPSNFKPTSDRPCLSKTQALSSIRRAKGNTPRLQRRVLFHLPLTISRGVLGLLVYIFITLSINVSLISQEENSAKDATEVNSVMLSSIGNILGDIRLIWPTGKCADNVSGDKSYILFTFACKADYTANNRKAFLDKMLTRGWKLRREDYHIDKNSATYFYKFQVDLDHDVYIKLFFRDPKVIWPLHENTRPKIIVFLNDVQNPEELQKWSELKLPLTVSVSLLSPRRESLVEMAKKYTYDTWLYLPDSVRLEGSREPIEEIKEQSKAELTEEQIAGQAVGQKAKPPEEIESDNQTPEDQISVSDSSNLETLSRELQKNPDQHFPFSGLSISATNAYIRNIELLRSLFKVMKKEGLKKFIGPSTPEIIDTARILELDSPNHTYYLGSGESIKEASWHEAYENSKINGYSVLILDARNMEARSFLLKMIQETISFIDYTTLEHVH